MGWQKGGKAGGLMRLKPLLGDQGDFVGAPIEYRL